MEEVKETGIIAGQYYLTVPIKLPLKLPNVIGSAISCQTPAGPYLAIAGADGCVRLVLATPPHSLHLAFQTKNRTILDIRYMQKINSLVTLEAVEFSHLSPTSLRRQVNIYTLTTHTDGLTSDIPCIQFSLFTSSGFSSPLSLFQNLFPERGGGGGGEQKEETESSTEQSSTTSPDDSPSPSSTSSSTSSSASSSIDSCKFFYGKEQLRPEQNSNFLVFCYSLPSEGTPTCIGACGLSGRLAVATGTNIRIWDCSSLQVLPPPPSASISTTTTSSSLVSVGSFSLDKRVASPGTKPPIKISDLVPVKMLDMETTFVVATIDMWKEYLVYSCWYEVRVLFLNVMFVERETLLEFPDQFIHSESDDDEDEPELISREEKEKNETQLKLISKERVKIECSFDSKGLPAPSTNSTVMLRVPTIQQENAQASDVERPTKRRGSAYKRLRKGKYPFSMLGSTLDATSHIVPNKSQGFVLVECKVLFHRRFIATDRIHTILLIPPIPMPQEPPVPPPQLSESEKEREREREKKEKERLDKEKKEKDRTEEEDEDKGPHKDRELGNVRLLLTTTHEGYLYDMDASLQIATYSFRNTLIAVTVESPLLYALTTRGVEVYTLWTCSHRLPSLGLNKPLLLWCGSLKDQMQDIIAFKEQIILLPTQLTDGAPPRISSSSASSSSASSSFSGISSPSQYSFSLQTQLQGTPRSPTGLVEEDTGEDGELDYELRHTTESYYEAVVSDYIDQKPDSTPFIEDQYNLLILQRVSLHQIYQEIIQRTMPPPLVIKEKEEDLLPISISLLTSASSSSSLPSTTTPSVTSPASTLDKDSEKKVSLVNENRKGAVIEAHFLLRARFAQLFLALGAINLKFPSSASSDSSSSSSSSSSSTSGSRPTSRPTSRPSTPPPRKLTASPRLSFTPSRSSSSLRSLEGLQLLGLTLESQSVEILLKQSYGYVADVLLLSSLHNIATGQTTIWDVNENEWNLIANCYARSARSPKEVFQLFQNAAIRAALSASTAASLDSNESGEQSSSGSSGTTTGAFGARLTVLKALTVYLHTIFTTPNPATIQEIKSDTTLVGNILSHFAEFESESFSQLLLKNFVLWPGFDSSRAVTHLEQMIKTSANPIDVFARGILMLQTGTSPPNSPVTSPPPSPPTSPPPSPPLKPFRALEAFGRLTPTQLQDFLLNHAQLFTEWPHRTTLIHYLRETSPWSVVGVCITLTNQGKLNVPDALAILDDAERKGGPDVIQVDVETLRLCYLETCVAFVSKFYPPPPPPHDDEHLQTEAELEEEAQEEVERSKKPSGRENVVKELTVKSLVTELCKAYLTLLKNSGETKTTTTPSTSSSSSDSSDSSSSSSSSSSTETPPSTASKPPGIAFPLADLSPLLHGRFKWLQSITPSTSVNTITKTNCLEGVQALLCSNLPRQDDVIHQAIAELPESSPARLSLLALSLPFVNRLGDAVKLVIAEAPNILLSYCKHFCKKLEDWECVLSFVLRELTTRRSFFASSSSSSKPVETTATTSSSPTAAEKEAAVLYHSLYNDIFNHLVQILEPESLLSLIPDNASLRFFLPYLQRSCCQASINMTHMLQALT